MRSMELEDSDDDDQVADSNMLTLVEAGVLGDEQVMNLDTDPVRDDLDKEATAP